MDAVSSTMDAVSSKCNQQDGNSSSLRLLESPGFRVDPIICLIDMDCFYVQVELRKQPEFRGKPTAVVQYKKDFRGGGLIAVSYEARARGVKRGTRATDAVGCCPELHCFAVPELNGKADLTRYREAGAETIKVMMDKFKRVERASIDEAFIDLTPEVETLLPKYLSGEISLTADELDSCHVPGIFSMTDWLDQLNLVKERAIAEKDCRNFINNLALTIGGKLVNELRKEMLVRTEFHCSAGISFSKTLAKLACGMNKPRKQTIFPMDSVALVYEKTSIQDVRFLGGKLGDDIVQLFGIKTMGELSQIPRSTLCRHFDMKTVDWISNLCLGRDGETVEPRQCPKSIGCSKNFMGPTALVNREQVKYWMAQFSHELEQRLKKDQLDNSRTAQTLTAHVRWSENYQMKSASKCVPLSSYEKESIAREAFEAADKLIAAMGCRDGVYAKKVITLGAVASKFTEGTAVQQTRRIDNYFQKLPSPKKLKRRNSQTSIKDEEPEPVSSTSNNCDGFPDDDFDEIASQLDPELLNLRPSSACSAISKESAPVQGNTPQPRESSVEMRRAKRSSSVASWNSAEIIVLDDSDDDAESPVGRPTSESEMMNSFAVTKRKLTLGSNPVPSKAPPKKKLASGKSGPMDRYFQR